MSGSPEPLDFDRLASWLAAHGRAAQRIELLRGDLSPRRYLRVHGDGWTAIVAFYPPEVRDACVRFRASTTLLAARGIRVPQLLASDCDVGWMLLEDVGLRTLYEHQAMAWPERERWLAAALEVPDRLRGLDRETVAALNPPLDAALLRRELEQTTELVLRPRGLGPDDPLGREVREFFDRTTEELGRGPLVPAHRDLMVRNLVPIPSGELAVLDHQDLRLAPPAYDVASLLNDSWFLPPEMEERLLLRCAGLGFGRRDYRLAAVQRTLKAAGTYAAFARRGADRHLPLLQPTLERALAHWRELEPESALAERVAERLLENC